MSRFLLLFIMFFGGGKLCINAQTVIKGTCGKDGSTVNWEFSFSQGLLLITGEGEMQDFALDQHPEWETLKDFIREISIEEGVTSIGTRAFADFKDVKALEVPTSVESIGDSAFCNWNFLRSYKIGENIKWISPTAFIGCYRLTRFVVEEGNGFFEIGSYGELIDRKNKRLLIFPASSSPHLTTYEIPENVTEIGGCAFNFCNQLQSVGIHANVTSVGEGAFASCSSLSSIKVSQENPFFVEENGILYNKGKSRLIVYPAALDGNALEVPVTVTDIARFAFSSCSKLNTVVLPSSVRTIGRSAFAACDKLEYVTFLNGMERIEKNAFSGCENLKSVSIPSSVGYIASDAFEGCSELNRIEVEGGNEAYSSSDDGMLFDKGKKILLFCAGNRNEVRLPVTLVGISSGAFADCTARKVYFPETLKSITLGALVFKRSKSKLDFYLPCAEPPRISDEERLAYFISNASTGKTFDMLFFANPLYRKFLNVIDSFRFKGDKDVVLHVPQGCKQKYVDRIVWRTLFGNKIKGDIK